MRFHRSRGAWRMVSATAGLMTILSAVPAHAATGATAATGADGAGECLPAAADARVGKGGTLSDDPNALTPAQVAARERDFAQAKRQRGFGLRTLGPTTLTTVSIPTYFHVLSTDGTRAMGNLPDSMIYDQVDVLNDAFAGAGFTFDLQSINHVTSTAWAPIWRGSNAEYEMKAALRQGGMESLNIYTGITNGQMVYGWSTFPTATFSTRDGVVIQYETLPGGSNAPANLGDTAVHEVGHWLNLYHTFQNGCDNGGDQISDTADEAYAAFDCPVGRDTCPTAGADPIHNYMDYTADSCIDHFTPGQVTRMQDAWAVYRHPTP